MEQFTKGEIDQVDIQYHHFKSAGSQVLLSEIYLPIKLEKENEDEAVANYLVEPSPQAILKELIPQALHLKLFSKYTGQFSLRTRRPRHRYASCNRQRRRTAQPTHTPIQQDPSTSHHCRTPRHCGRIYAVSTSQPIPQDGMQNTEYAQRM